MSFENNKDKDIAGKFLQIIDNKSKKEINKADKKYLKSKNAIVISYDKTTSLATVKFPDIEKEYSFYNKSGEKLKENDRVKIEYTNNLSQGYIVLRIGVLEKDNEVEDTAHKKLTVQEFEALSQEEQDNGTIYFVEGAMGESMYGDTINIENPIIIQRKDMSKFIHEYTHVRFVYGNNTVYGGVKSDIICGEYVWHKTADVWDYDTVTTIEGTFSYELTEVTSAGAYKFTVTKPTGTTTITSYGSMGFAFQWSSIYPPDETHPFGWAKGSLYPIYTANTGKLTRGTSTVVTLDFVSEAEYNSAINLTTVPVKKTSTIETVTEVTETE